MNDEKNKEDKERGGCEEEHDANKKTRTSGVEEQTKEEDDKEN